MKVWVIVTCVPGEPEPCWPSVYSTEEKAESASDMAMRAEWASNSPEDSETGDPLPYPDDAVEAHAQLVELLGPEWGRWEICPVEMDAEEEEVEA